jgi:16S rRNA (guanine527-N7)-methyltransferase
MNLEIDPEIGPRLNALLTEAGLAQLDEPIAQQFAVYMAILTRWNARTNLTAIRDHEGILRRHFVESIACAHALPPGIHTLLDLGSGGGFPGIPIALCRPEIAVTLAESQGKKAAFLQEAVRVLGLPVKVHAGRAETLTSTYDCVTLRAVDRMQDAIRAAASLLAPAGHLAVLSTRSEEALIAQTAGSSFEWPGNRRLFENEDRILALGRRK